MSNFFETGLGLVVIAAALAVVVAWVVLPFAVIGAKGLLRQLVEAQRETNRLLQHQAGTADRPNVPRE